MKDIVIVGASGMGKEVAWLIENININNKTWNIIGFIDDNPSLKEVKTIFRYPFLGSIDWFETNNNKVFVVIAIGRGTVRKNVQEKLVQFNNIKFATLVDPSVRIDQTISIGSGSIICRNCTITVDTIIGNGVLMNTGASVGHDSVIGNYCTLLTNSIVAGHTNIGEGCEIGSGAFILQGKTVAANTVIAPLSTILKDITEAGTYIGNPARRMI
jgi:sugar O-acyltransferase (sialic acid O-acetyltransferase NeuD family)